jgi:hypothetical protein
MKINTHRLFLPAENKGRAAVYGANSDQPRSENPVATLTTSTKWQNV